MENIRASFLWLCQNEMFLPILPRNYIARRSPWRIFYFHIVFICKLTTWNHLLDPPHCLRKKRNAASLLVVFFVELSLAEFHVLGLCFGKLLDIYTENLVKFITDSDIFLYKSLLLGEKIRVGRSLMFLMFQEVENCSFWCHKLAILTFTVFIALFGSL